MTSEACYLGTDVGGTFTDLVFYAANGEVHCFKVPSTPARPGASILEGVDEIKATLGLDNAAWRELVHTHSSTVATNALIERKGARVGLLVSTGFRDLFELQRLAIPHPMRFDSRRPQPLVPRALVREIGGRIAADGSELDPVDTTGAAQAARELVALGVEIAVVVLLHSYRNPAPEQAVRAAIERERIKLRLELSSEVVAFGGAGPLVAALLAEEIGIDAILIPPFPGGLSALGAARADLEGDLVEPVYERLGALDKAALARVEASLQHRAAAWIAEQTAALMVTQTHVELAADMRYDGQGFDVTVPLDAAWLSSSDFDRLRTAFHAAHRATYGHADENAEIWLKELRAHIVGATPKPLIMPPRPEAAGGGEGTRTVRLFSREVAARVYERAALTIDQRIAMPAIVNQMDTTTWIPEGWHARVVSSGALVLERQR